MMRRKVEPNAWLRIGSHHYRVEVIFMSPNVCVALREDGREMQVGLIDGAFPAGHTLTRDDA